MIEKLALPPKELERWCKELKQALGYDDSLDVFGVHGVGSSLGMLLCGVFASASVNPAIATMFKSNGHVVSLVGGPAQLLNQMIGVLFTVGYSTAATLIILKVVNVVVGLRVNEDEERQGLDVSQHGETAYNDEHGHGHGHGHGMTTQPAA